MTTTAGIEAAARLARAAEVAAAGLVGRSEAARAIVRAAVAGVPSLLVGPPGVAKSLLARRLAAAINGSYFECLLGRFSSPEDIFGPLDLPSLESGEYRRRTDGYAPSAEVLFLDEVFRGGPGLLNSLLSLINERLYHNGRELVRVPARVIVGASNSLPSPDGDEAAELSAIADRWAVRVVVRAVAPADRAAMIWTDPPAVSAVASVADVDAATECARRLPWSADGRAAMLAAIEAAAEAVPAARRPSDRRMRQAAAVVAAEAALAGADEVGVEHVAAAAEVLWSDLADEAPVRAAVLRVADADGAAAADALAAAAEAEEQARSTADIAPRIAAARKLDELARTVAGLKGARADEARRAIEAIRRRVHAALLGVSA
jgi:MoxR-like ATPase